MSLTAAQLVKKLKRKSVLLLCHENADLDSFCSAAMMQRFLKKKMINAFIGIPSHINEHAQSLALREKISFYINPNLPVFNVVILFDFNHLEQMGRLGKSFEALMKCNCFEVMAFDHHVPEKGSIVHEKNAIISDKCVSTTQLVRNFLDIFEDSEIDFLNCLGIMEDTGHFLVGNSESFESFSSSLKNSGRSFAEVLAFTKHNLKEDERIAFLKAAQRAQILKLGSAIVAVSELSFYQGPAASKLLDFGAHIAVVAGQEKNELTILSARADSEFKENNKFNLMKHLFVPLQEKLGGAVGGHSGAAQWKGKAGVGEVKRVAIEILKRRFN
ncbi:DHH family protein [uncultured archaeon]|nr:DHH family protein [uncultured archaeon]